MQGIAWGACLLRAMLTWQERVMVIPVEGHILDGMVGDLHRVTTVTDHTLHRAVHLRHV